MRGEIACAIALLFLSGCAPAALAPEQAAAGLVQSVGSTADNLFNAKSLRRLNTANAQLTEAQANLTADKAMESAIEAQRVTEERIVTVHLLKRMSRMYSDPLLEILAQWVAGGGDPNFAFKYALMQVRTAPPVRVIPSHAAIHSPQMSIAPVGYSSQACQRPPHGRPGSAGSSTTRLSPN